MKYIIKMLRQNFKIPVGILSVEETEKILHHIIEQYKYDPFLFRELERKDLLKERKQKLNKLFKK